MHNSLYMLNVLDLTYDAKCYGSIVICYYTNLSLGIFCDANKTIELMHVVPKCL